jgi:hypothetical protein
MFARLIERWRRRRGAPDHAQTKTERLEQQHEPRLMSRRGDVRAEDLWPTKLDDERRP